jgi:hypothetical protein
VFIECETLPLYVRVVAPLANLTRIILLSCCAVVSTGNSKNMKATRLNLQVEAYRMVFLRMLDKGVSVILLAETMVVLMARERLKL